MPLGQLRISGLLQASVIAFALGFLFRDTPATDQASTWPYVLGGYGFVAAVAPWLAGGLDRSSLSIRLSAVLGLLFAAPVALSAYWLSTSPYSTISIGCWVLVALWAVHFAVSVAMRKG